MSNERLTGVRPPSCQAERESYKQLIEQAARLLTMTKTPGWVEVFRPMVVQRRQAELDALVEVKNHDDMLRLQGSLREVNEILGFVETTIQLAERAQEALQNEPEAPTPTRLAGQSS